jgi:hypothetical protein
VLHLDCARLRRKHFPTETLSQMWLLGSWFPPWLGAYHDTPIRPTSLDATAVAMKHPDMPKDFRIMVERVKGLPPELRNAIVDYCSNSHLWRFVIALAWRPELFYYLRNEKIKTLLPNALDFWVRGDPGNGNIVYRKSMNGTQNLKFFRMGLDAVGIRSIQLLNSRSTPPDPILQSCSWYIVEDIARLEDFKIESNVG